MKQTAEVQDTRFDALKWTAAVVLAAVAVAGNVYFADQPMIYRVVGVVVLVVAALGIALTTSRGRELTSLARNAKKEIQRVVWPTRQETFQTTAIVLGAVVIVGLLLWLIDMFFGWLVSTLIG